MVAQVYGAADRLPLAGGTMTGPLVLSGSPPLEIPSGAASGSVLTSDSSGHASWGSVALAAGLLTPTAVKTGTYAASAGDFVPADASSGNVTVTLPSAPADKTRIGVKLVATNTGATHSVTINASGSDVFNKASGSTSASLSLLNQGMLVQYAASTGIWYVQTDDLPLSQLDKRYLQVVPSTGDTSGAGDTPILQAALTAGYLRLIPGHAYYVNATLTYPQYCVIDGGGTNAFSPARIYMANGANLNAVLASTGWAGSSNTTSQGGVVIKGLQIEGNSSNQTGGAGHGIVTQNYDSRFEGLVIKDTIGDGIRLDFYGANGTSGISNTMVQIRIVDCEIIGAGAYGIHSTDPTSTSAITDGFIERCIIQGAGISSISLSASAGWLIHGCHLYGIPQNGISAGRPFNTRILGNVVEQFGQSATSGFYSGISVSNAQQSQGVIIANNSLEIVAAPGNSGSTLRAIDFEATTSVTANAVITGNHAVCNQTSGAAAYIGILVASASGSTVNVVHTGNGIDGTWTNTLLKNTNGGTINDNGAGV